MCKVTLSWCGSPAAQRSLQSTPQFPVPKLTAKSTTYLIIMKLFCEMRHWHRPILVMGLVKLITLLPDGFCCCTRSIHLGWTLNLFDQVIMFVFVFRIPTHTFLPPPLPTPTPPFPSRAQNVESGMDPYVTMPCHCLICRWWLNKPGCQVRPWSSSVRGWLPRQCTKQQRGTQYLHYAPPLSRDVGK